MRTIVFQSFRAHDVPGWLETCLGTVRDWAAARGHDYRFYDDSFFDFAPRWYRERVGHRILPVSDLARLRLARALLEEGWDRAVWVDADMLVFAPARFGIEAPAGYAFVREVWTSARGAGPVTCDERVNNSVSVFCRGNPMLEFYIHACERAATGRELSDWHVGTAFLTVLHRAIGLPLLGGVGIVSPQVLRELVRGGSRVSAAYMQAVGEPLGAVNLCGSFAGRTADGVANAHADYAAAVTALLEGGGAALNDLLEPSRAG